MKKHFGIKFLFALSLVFVVQLMLFSTKTYAATTDNNILPPSNLTYQFTTPKDVKLSWSSVYGATGYNIYGITEGQLLLLKTTTSTNYTFSSLPEGSYTYVVSTLSAVGESGPCAPVYVDVIYPDMLAPASLTNAIQNGNDIVLSWSASLYAQSYKIYVYSADGQQSLLASVAGSTYTISNVAEGAYTYAVSAVNATYGESPVSTPLQVTVTFPVMAAPSSVTYKLQNGNDVVLTWGTVTYANSYKVYELIDGQEVLKTTVTSATATFNNVPAGDHTYVVHSVSTRFGESAAGKQITLNIAAITMQAPANLNYSLSNGTNITMTWGAVTYATAYKIYQVVDGQNILKNTVTGTSVSYTNLPAGDYVYEVFSYSDRFGESSVGSLISFTIGSVTMTPPSNFAYIINNGNDMVFTWDNVANATNYRIYQISNGQKTLKSTVTGTTISYTNMPAGDYTYEIYSYSSVYGESPEGSKLVFTLTFPEIQPPANLIQTLNSTSSFTLKWDAALYANNYKVYQIVNGQKVLKSTVTGTTITFTNMAPGDYNYEIHSYSTRFGESITGSTLLVTLNGQIMQAPANLTYTAANVNDVTLKWSAADSATSYKVYQVIGGQNVLMKTVTTTSAAFTYLPAGDYDYIVTSVSTLYGESPSGAEITFSLVLPTMAAPGNLNFKIQNVNSVVLTWDAVAYANSYKVYEIISGQKVLKTTVTTLTATISSLSAGDHTYVVHSVSTRFGESQEGSQVSLTLSQQMLPPTNLAYSIVNGNDITLTWTAASYANSYQIYQVIDGQKVLKKTATGTSATFTNMPAGDYDYMVTSVSSIFGESLDGSEITLSLVHPIMTAPVNLTYRIQNGNSVVLTWGAVNYATNYKVYELVNGQEVLKSTVTALTATLANQSVDDHTYIVRSFSSRFGESQEGSQVTLTIAQQMLPPTNLTYTIANGNDIKLAWTAASYANSYLIYQVVDGQRVFVKTVTSTSVTFTNMPAGDYEYVVTSVSTIFGESSDGADITITLVHPIMAAPANLSQSIANGNDFTLKWSSVTYATSYNIYQVINGQKLLVKALSAINTTFTNMPAGDYTYEVDSNSSRFGESPIGSIIRFTLVWPVVQPPVLQDTIYNVNNITLTWQAVTWANEYRVYEVTDNTRQLLYKGTLLSYKLYNLSEDTHSYEVTAYSTRFGESAPSNRITENIIYPIMQSPVAHIKLIDATTAVIYWDFITYANGYNVYEIVDGNPVLLTENLNNLSYQLTNLTHKDHLYYVTSYSNSFGESQPSDTVLAKLIVDTEAPVTTSDVPLDWVNQLPVTVTLSATDNETGVANTYYSVNDGIFTEGTSIIVDQEGINKLSFYSIDKEGNKEAVKTVYVNIDQTAPVTSFKAPDNWSKEDAVVNLTASDNQSGAANTFYSIDGSEYIEGTIFTVKDDGIYKINYYSVDTAGNKEVVNTAEVKIDKTAPVTISDVQDNWSREDVIVHLSASDSLSGVDNTFYSIDGSEYIQGTTFTIKDEGIHKINYYSVDAAGNKEVVNTAEVKIDKTVPVLSTDLNKEYKLGTTLQLAYTAMDVISGITSEKMVVFTPNDTIGKTMDNNTNILIDQPGVYTITVTVVDAAGNTATIKRQLAVYIPATIEVTPIVIKGNSGIFTVRVSVPTEFSTRNFDLNTATLNGVSALTSNNGYYNQAKLGQFKFERSDFNWNQPYVTVEFRCYMNGYLVIGQTTVKVQK